MPRTIYTILSFCCVPILVLSNPVHVVDTRSNVTFRGTSQQGVEQFLNIPYGQAQRFKKSELFLFPRGTSYDATKLGPTCPQQVNPGAQYGTLATPQSEDCLRLKVARPEGVKAGDNLPVMVYLYGGSAILGNINDIRTEPTGLIQRSVANGLPVLYVAISYRLSIFGFAAAKPLRDTGSLNLGLKDQRLGLEWIQQNIAYFGGDPNRITLFGQSTGGLHSTVQLLAYGGSKPIPFHRAIMESTTLQNGVTTNVTWETYNAVVKLAGCETDGSPQSTGSLECLRALPVDHLLNVTLTQLQSVEQDVYLPVVDGDFLPEAPSSLVRKGSFPNIPVMIGWAENDMALFVPFDIATGGHTRAFIQSTFNTLRNETVEHLLSLYPTSDFFPANNLSAEFYRAAQIFRDVAMVCPSLYFGHAMSQKFQHSPQVYFFDQNQTVLSNYFDKQAHPGLGVIHSSEMPYIFGIRNFNGTGDMHPTQDDLELFERQSASWSTFARFGTPSLPGKQTLPGWQPAYSATKVETKVSDANVFVVQQPGASMSKLDGRATMPGVVKQKLKTRCTFLTRDDVIAQLHM